MTPGVKGLERVNLMPFENVVNKSEGRLQVLTFFGILQGVFEIALICKKLLIVAE